MHPDDAVRAALLKSAGLHSDQIDMSVFLAELWWCGYELRTIASRTKSLADQFADLPGVTVKKY